MTEPGDRIAGNNVTGNSAAGNSAARSGAARSGAARIVHPLDGRLTYADYLGLDQVLTAQRPMTTPAHHDEPMFIIFHQVTELWFKLVLHETDHARARLGADDAPTAQRALRRTAEILQAINHQWCVLEDLRPEDFDQIRTYLDTASGLESKQYGAIEILLGRRRRRSRQATTPSLFDEFLRFLHRRRYHVPREYLLRDWTKQRGTEGLENLFAEIYRNPDVQSEIHALCEGFNAIDDELRRWRQRHLDIVEKLIGGRMGTGGTSGLSYLAAKVDHRYFPELHRARATR